MTSGSTICTGGLEEIATEDLIAVCAAKSNPRQVPIEKMQKHLHSEEPHDARQTEHHRHNLSEAGCQTPRKITHLWESEDREGDQGQAYSSGNP